MSSFPLIEFLEHLDDLIKTLEADENEFSSAIDLAYQLRAELTHHAVSE